MEKHLDSDSDQSISYSFSESNSEEDHDLFEKVPIEIYIHGYSPDQISTGENNSKLLDFKSALAADRASKYPPDRSIDTSDEENKSTYYSSGLSSLKYEESQHSSGLHSDIITKEGVDESVKAIRIMQEKEHDQATGASGSGTAIKQQKKLKPSGVAVSEPVITKAKNKMKRPGPYNVPYGEDESSRKLYTTKGNRVQKPTQPRRISGEASLRKKTSGTGKIHTDAGETEKPLKHKRRHGDRVRQEFVSPPSRLKPYQAEIDAAEGPILGYLTRVLNNTYLFEEVRIIDPKEDLPERCPIPKKIEKRTREPMLLVPEI